MATIAMAISAMVGESERERGTLNFA